MRCPNCGYHMKTTMICANEKELTCPGCGYRELVKANHSIEQDVRDRSNDQISYHDLMEDINNDLSKM